jgi:SagB-type dehydrogenase family enzyme
MKLFNSKIIFGVLLAMVSVCPLKTGECMNGKKMPKMLQLPQPRYDSPSSLESALVKRRSVRRYLDEPLTLAEISQLLWAAQGITHSRGFRTAPSAGALYPLELYLAVGEVTDLGEGIYKYDPHGHGLAKIVEGDRRAALCRAALNQGAVKNAPAVIVFCAVYRRITVKYGQRGIRYVFMEVGHSSQNVCLQAASLDLGTVTIGAFDDQQVKNIIGCLPDEEPLYMMPVGRWKK